MRLNVRAFALACGLLWGVGLFLATWWIILFDGASSGSLFLGRLYRGYTVTPIGSLIGLVWALVDGFIGGALLAWLYNLLGGSRAAASKA
ncbi:MAG: bacteriophage holin [Candidatus Krumholzibacteriota bacterium]|nr:bacteriophage holin [Candidatus Krumholzibacteriota bacterium]